MTLKLNNKILNQFTYILLILNFPMLISSLALKNDNLLVNSTTLANSNATDLCNPSPCANNTICSINSNSNSKIVVCECQKYFYGDPYINCRAECRSHSECPHNKACHQNKCIDPCPGVCGLNAKCEVVNHYATCSCGPGFNGNPFVQCSPFYAYTGKVEILDDMINRNMAHQCNPSPCGEYAMRISGPAICRCIEGSVGDPFKGCRWGCLSSADCGTNRFCSEGQCVDPCPGPCGPNSRCDIGNNHTTSCDCPPGYEGNPLIGCTKIKTATTAPSSDQVYKDPIINPCSSYPCGVHGICAINSGDPVSVFCRCNPFYNLLCVAECVINDDCQSNQICSNYKCVDPCPRICGPNSKCEVKDHVANCTCLQGFEGDAAFGCDSGNGSISAECIANWDCPLKAACINHKCVDPCPGVCGLNSVCSVNHHSTQCSCPQGYQGSPYNKCELEQRPIHG